MPVICVLSSETVQSGLGFWSAASHLYRPDVKLPWHVREATTTELSWLGRQREDRSLDTQT